MKLAVLCVLLFSILSIVGPRDVPLHYYSSFALAVTALVTLALMCVRAIPLVP
jgi:hypothetical protein